MILKRGSGQYLWDENDNRLIDLLAMNVCISVGHAHPDVARAAQEQAAMLSHCTTMFYHPVPAHYCEELAATMPEGYNWVVHLTNSGAEAIDLALMMARFYTERSDIIALQSSYHGPTYGAQSVTGISGFRHEVAFQATFSSQLLQTFIAVLLDTMSIVIWTLWMASSNTELLDDWQE